MDGKRVTLVTGASSGIGAEIAREAAHRGHRLVLSARRADRLETLAQEIGGETDVIVADLARHDGPASLVAEIERRGLEVDCLVNNAGFGRHGHVAGIGLEPQLGQVDVNVRALTELTVRLSPAMIAHRRGAILNVASLGSFQPGPNVAVYFATKAFVLSFTEALHEELRGYGIKVTALCPGPTRSEFAHVAGLAATAAFRADAFLSDAAVVARYGLDALDRNCAVAIPGLVNRFTAFATRFSPRSVNRRVAGWLQS